MQHSPYHRRRPRPPPQPIVIQPGQAAFRVVCHVSIISGLIGHSGSIISQIRRGTGCIVHCEEQVQRSDHRVITIVGTASPGKTITLKSTNGLDDDNDEEKELVSFAQEAVIRVCERMWEVDAQMQRRGEGIGYNNNINSEGYCGLLADTTQIGAVVGRGGKNVSRMRRESGAGIRVLPAPYCASKGDDLIQITGTILAVKKALIAVTECLHDCPPYEKDPMLFTRSQPLERASHMASSDPHEEFFPHLSSLLPPPLNGNSANSHSLYPDAAEDPHQGMEALRHQVSFRLLCSNAAAGSIIGKKGTIIRTLQNQTGASIMFAAPLTMSVERVVIISALENLESWHSPAQNAVILVFARSIEHDIGKGHPSGLIEFEGATVTARLLVASDAVCCLIEKSGKNDCEMIEVSGAGSADIRLLKEEQILEHAPEHDVVIGITGEYKNVQNALFIVTGKLRGHLLHREVLNEGKTRSPQGLHQSGGHPPDSVIETSLTRGMNQLGFSSSLDNASLPELQSPKKFEREHTTVIKNHKNSSKTFGGGLELDRSLHFHLPKEVLNEVSERCPNGGARETTNSESLSSFGQAYTPIQETLSTRRNYQPHLSNNIGIPFPALHMPQTAGRSSTTFGGHGGELESCSRSFAVGNTIVELIIPEDILGSVYGEEGSNLARLRQISGAKVEVRDPSPSKNERMAVISGTPDQTRAAQSLLQAFILADQ